jgi:hypothetical protein
MNTHLHFIVWAWEKVEPGTGNFINNTTLDLIAESSEDALLRAAKFVKKPEGNYCVRSVIEHYDGQCHVQH